MHTVLKSDHVQDYTIFGAYGSLDFAPVFSVVIPMYRVEQYLPDLLQSFSKQTIDPSKVEYIFLDDGSPQNESQLVKNWATTTPINGILVEKDNEGVSVTRNLGIELAHGKWITFPDSDDFVSENYFDAIEKFSHKKSSSELQIIAANLLRYFEDIDEVRDSHGLRWRFKTRSKSVNLEVSPHYIHLHAASTFFNLEALKAAKIGFMRNLHASEDALFVAEFILSLEKPKLGLVVDAQYLYRKRSAGDSAVDSFKKKKENYFERFINGYLPLLERAKDGDEIPDWLASLVLYELRWIFSDERRPKSRAYVLGSEGGREFLEVCCLLLSYITTTQIYNYRSSSLLAEIRLLFIALKGVDLGGPIVHVTKFDSAQNLVQCKYYFQGVMPREQWWVRGKEVLPIHDKVRKLDYFGQDVLHERVVWLPANSWLTAKLNGKRAQIEFGPVKLPRFAVTEREYAAHYPSVEKSLADVNFFHDLNKAAKGRAVARKMRKGVVVEELTEQEISDHAFYELRKLSSVSPENSDLWLLMDRVEQAADNAYHLYKKVRDLRGDSNLRFVLKRDSKDWPRLESEGFNLLEYRSLDHLRALMRAKIVASSHIDVEIVRPFPEIYYCEGRKPWRFVFLQHGVTQNDLSHWFNGKDIDLLISATPEEHKSFVDNDTSYNLTTREVKLTGFPRHDGLVHADKDHTEKKFLTIAPTWRDSLFGERLGFGGVRGLIDDFEGSDYFIQWFGLLNSETLKAFAAQNNLSLAFLPHPVLEPVLNKNWIPSGVSLLSYSDTHLQENISSSSYFITDYSSVAFDAAITGARISYLQFDADAVSSGAHFFVRGYFSYEEQGLGPVFSDYQTLSRHLLENSDSSEWSEYERRAKDTFVMADGQASERVIAAIEALDIPVKKV